MISVTQAKNLVLSNIQSLGSTNVDLSNALGLMLAQDIYAPGDFPPFPQSAMDGYAFNFNNWNNTTLKVKGIVQAGETQQSEINNQHAVRIFTGAPVPAGLDTVVMQEKVTVEQECITIHDLNLKKGANVRLQGAEIKKGAIALHSGTYLSAGAIGFIAGLGINHFNVIPKPAVSILVTGKELQKPGNPLGHGQVYESNSYAVTAALAQQQIVNVTAQIVDDDMELLTRIIESELLKSDMVLLTGGVSVGDYDFVTKALRNAGVNTIFHKVKQKPGKPLLFGKKGNKVIFGLPGNPSSVLTCFYEYVMLAIQHLMGLPSPLVKTGYLPLLSDYNKNAGLTHFLKARVTANGVKPLDAQESFKMSSFARADCLIILDEENTVYQKGDLVAVHFINNL